MAGENGLVEKCFHKLPEITPVKGRGCAACNGKAKDCPDYILHNFNPTPREWAEAEKIPSYVPFYDFG